MEVLAWRKFPEPKGENYTKEELCYNEKVVELFDYCQIAEAVIFDIGWKYLFEKFSLTGIIEIDSQSQWMEEEDIGEWICSVFYNSLISGYNPLKNELGKYDQEKGVFTNLRGELVEIDWSGIYQLKRSFSNSVNDNNAKEQL